MISTDARPEELRRRAERLDAERSKHKRSMRYHRRRLRRVSEQLAELEAACDQLGITLELQGVEGGDLHGQQQEQERRPTTQPIDD